MSEGNIQKGKCPVPNEGPWERKGCHSFYDDIQRGHEVNSAGCNRAKTIVQYFFFSRLKLSDVVRPTMSKFCNGSGYTQK